MSPFEISIMIHYYARVDDHEALRRDPPIARETFQKFIDAELLEYIPTGERDQYGASYRVTEGGRVYVDALQTVPLPVRRWVMP